jgi:hypothetical protein
LAAKTPVKIFVSDRDGYTKTGEEKREKVSEKGGENQTKKLAINSIGKLNVPFLPETNKIDKDLKIIWIYSRSS